MVVNNPNNWHWVERNTLPWAKQYLGAKLETVSIDNETHEIFISSTTIDGDCDVSQRKGKVICIYDLNLSLDVKGKDKIKDEEIKGVLKIDEFIHDEQDYEFEFKEFGDDKHIVEKSLKPIILEILYNFQNDLINAHSKDLQE